MLPTENYQTSQLSNYQTLIDLAIASAELETGAPLRVRRSNSMNTLFACAGIQAARPPRGPQSPPWDPTEDDFLKANLGRLSEADIAASLGRTEIAVRLRWKRDLRLVAPTKDPAYITTNRIARLLGVDNHKTVYWADSGLLPHERLPFRRRVTRRVPWVTFLRWVVNPQNWVWFDPERVPDPHLRRLLELKAARWGDEWWDTNQVAAYHGVKNCDVVRYLDAGLLSGVHPPSIGGRHFNPHWSRWFVLRSEATRPDLVFHRGTGQGHQLDWSDRADAFLILARAVGLSTNAIAALMGWYSQRVTYRLGWLHRYDLIPALIERHRLAVRYRPEDGALFADWSEHRDRFPRLAASMRRFAAYVSGDHSLYRRRLTRGQRHPDFLAVRGVLHAWAAWRLPASSLARDLNWSSAGRSKALLSALSTLRSHGVDPLTA
jgi:hypothetical protein